MEPAGTPAPPPPAPPPGGRLPRAAPPRRGLELAGTAALALLLLVFLYAPVQDPDVWWHLKAGWLILARSAVPHTNLFAQAAGHPWIDHHWLYQVLLFGLWKLAGPAGLIGLRVAAVGAAWLLLARAATPPGGFLAMLPFLALGIVASNERMIDRPEIFSFLFLVITLALLLRWRRRPGPRPLVALVGLQVLWANFHGLAVLGPVAAGAFLLGEAVRRHAAAPGDGAAPPLQGLALALLAGTCALALTPNGLVGALHPLTLLRQLDNPAIAIAEFQGAFSGFRVTAAILAFRLLVGLAGALLLLSLPRLDWSLLILSALMLVLAAAARRNVPLFVIAALPLVGAQLPLARARLARLLPREEARRRLGAAGTIAVIACTLLLARDAAGGRFYERDGRIKRLGGGVDEAAVLRETMDYVTRRDLPGPVFNDIDSGGYFIWRAYPDRRAFIDARLEAVSPERIAAYDRAIRSRAGWEALDSAYHFGTVVLDHTLPLHGPLIDRLAADPDWALVHLDPNGIVFTRRRRAPAALLARDELAPGRRAPRPLRAAPRRADPLARALRGMLAVPEEPDLRASLAYARVLARLGFSDRARDAVRVALLEAPRSPRALVTAGAVEESAGAWDAARRRYEQALAADPACLEAYLDLGRLALRGGDAAGALARFDQAVALAPEDARARFLRGAALLALGRATEGRADLDRAAAIDPGLAHAADSLRAGAAAPGATGPHAVRDGPGEK